MFKIEGKRTRTTATVSRIVKEEVNGVLRMKMPRYTGEHRADICGGDETEMLKELTFSTGVDHSGWCGCEGVW